MDEHRCPDCGVTMAETKYRAGPEGDRIRLVTDERRGGILGSLGMAERLDVVAFVCPECGLVRFYADASE